MGNNDIPSPDQSATPVALDNASRGLLAMLTAGPHVRPLRKQTMIVLALGLLAAYSALLSATGDGASIAPMIMVAVSAGAASIAGFAFSAVSQVLLAPLMHDPVRLVQILMLCSITTQSYAVLSLWQHMDWRRLPFYLAGGVLGLPFGVYMLLHLHLAQFHVAIGVLLVLYGTYVLLKRPLVLSWGGWPAEVAVGFLGGITGGLAAFPGAAITIWCSMKGWDKARQRGVYQPFILVMQVMALMLIAVVHPRPGAVMSDASSMLKEAFIFVPATVLGSWFGLHIFHRISNRNFERVLAVLLAFSGLLLIV